MPVVAPVLTRIGGGASALELTYGSTVHLSVPLDAPLAAGHACLIVTVSAPWTEVSNIADGANAYARLTSAMEPNEAIVVGVWLATAGLARPAGTIVTFETAGQSYEIAAVIYDVAGLDLGSPLIGMQYAYAKASEAWDVTPVGVATTTPSLLALGIGAWATVSTGTPPDVGAFLVPWDTDTPVKVSGLTTGTSYNYRLSLAVSHHTDAAAIGSYTATLGGGAGAYRMALVALLAGAGINHPPRAPSLHTVPGLNAGVDQLLAWTFSDPDAGDHQSAYQLRITEGGSVVVDTGSTPPIASTASSHLLPAHTLTNGHTYQWAVRTWDADGLVGPYSALGSLVCVGAPTAVITTPVADATVWAANTMTVRWTYASAGGLAQLAWRLTLTESGLLRWDSTERPGADGSVALGVPLVDATSYLLTLLVQDANGSWSAAITRSFTTSFLPVVRPLLTVTPQAAAGYIALAAVAPAPGAGEDGAAQLAFLRRDAGERAWTVLATAPGNAAAYRDYGAVDEVTHEYQAVAYGMAGGQAGCLPLAASISFEGIWLYAASDPAGTAYHFLYDNGARGDTLAPVVSLVRYAGRSFALAEFDVTGTEATVHCELTLPWDLGGRQSSDRVALEALVARRETLCYRDHRSRKVWGVAAGGISFEDALLAYTTTLTLQRVDYDEGVPAAIPPPRGADLTATTTPQALVIDAPCSAVLVQADPANTQTVRVGWQAVQPLTLAPNASVTLPAANANQVYVHTESETAVVHWLALEGDA